ncbi:MAG: hypothetical protein LBJ10_06770 [Clostridiales bacterium]|nr:hypothetical protein [Clostridiales bacterium]
MALAIPAPGAAAAAGTTATGTAGAAAAGTAGAAAGRRPVAYVDEEPADPELAHMADATATYNTDYWHYSGGYWRDGSMAESAIRDADKCFWTNPEEYAGHAGLRIRARAALPQSVKDHLAAGGGVELAVRQRLPDLVETAYGVEYELAGDELLVYAMPKFNVQPDASYRTYEPSLPDLVPIVKEGYGWNMYAMYRRGAKLGVLESSHRPDPARVEFTDILGREGHLKPGKHFMIRDPDTGWTTEADSGDVTIGDGSFGLLGAVGVWFAFEFDVAFYRARAPDLSVESVGPARAEAGKPARVEVRLRNSGGALPAPGAVRLDVSIGGDKRSLMVEMGEKAEAAAALDWTPPDEAATVEIAAEANPDRAIAEDDYANNALRATVAVEKEEIPPDFAVAGIRQSPDPAAASSVAMAYVAVKNLGGDAGGDVALRFSDGRGTWEKRVGLGGGEEREIEFEWLAQDSPGEMALWAHINPERAVEEPDYGNNRMELGAAVASQRADLSVASITPSQYPAGMAVVTLVEVRNDGERQFGGGAGVWAGGLGGAGGVPVSFSIPELGIDMAETVYLDKGSSAYVPFAWEAPRSPSRLTIIAAANRDRGIEEPDYSNNSMELAATISGGASPAFGASTVRREWTERRLSHYQSAQITVNGTPVSVERPVYSDRRFYAEVSISAALLPGSMKSGYGVECEVSARLSTNYDRPADVIGIQSVHAYLPTSGCAEAIELEPVPGSGSRWRFPVNSASVSGARVRYVPVEWPDGTAFRIGFTGRGAQCPGGSMAASEYAETRISGNMFEDDATSSAR